MKELVYSRMFLPAIGANADSVATIDGPTQRTYAEHGERVLRLANALKSELGIARSDRFALMATNSSQYLELYHAAFLGAGVVNPLNLRLAGKELEYIIRDSGTEVAFVDAMFAEHLQRALAEGDGGSPLRHVVLIGDGDVPHDVKYEDLLAAGSTDVPEEPEEDDPVVLMYTGGTTGLPKGVLWRHEDIFFTAMGGGDPFQLGDHITRAEQLAGRIPDFPLVALPAPPFMHAAAHWLAFAVLFGGGKVVTLPEGRFDPAATWRLVDDEGVNILVVVGDAMARPLADALAADPGAYDLSTLMAMGSGGALLSPSTKARLRELRPGLIVRDAFGSSETGQIGGEPPADDPDGSPRLHVDERTAVLDDDLRPVAPGSGTVGRLARGGRVPLRYLGDPEKSAATFVEVGGVRWALPGDLATVEGDGTIVILGRSSQCINTGGEKVYPEEVEAALKAHPDVVDAVVVGVADERWGQSVSAVVQPRPGTTPTLDELRDAARDQLAGYKLPRRLVLVDEVLRSPAGKPDHRWALSVAAAAALPGEAGP